MKCAERLAKMHKKKYCIFTSNGTCALAIALASTEDNRRKVIIPAIVCPSVYFAVYYAGKIPIVADINLPYGDISSASVEDLLKKGDVCAVVGVHLFGNSFDTISLRFLCDTYGVVFVEDTAQALGGISQDGIPFGVYGDIAILSFGHTKILDIGNGGAVLCNDEKLYNKISVLEDSLPFIDPQQGVILDRYRDVYYALWAAGKEYSRFHALFQGVGDIVKKAYIYKRNNIYEDRLMKGLDMLPGEVDMRHMVAQIYLNELADEENIIPLYVPMVGVPWRFSCLVPEDKRDALVESIRKKEIDISTWYPSVHRWIPENITFPEDALEFEKRVINLWVTSQYKNKILYIIKCLRRLVQ